MEEIRKSRNGLTIIFYKNDKNDSKYSWKIENDAELTALLLQNSKSKKVKGKAIRYATEGIFEKIANRNSLKTITEQVKNNNPIVELAEYCQKMFGGNIITKNLGQIGPDHAPTIKVSITLPSGKVFEACGSSKAAAKVKAAREALEFLS